jgi:DNA-3-methyladenine glycosylase II
MVELERQMITAKAKQHLIKADSRMRKLVQTLKMRKYELRENEFRSLVGSIVSQQLSVKAARTINKRMCEALGTPRYNHKQILKIPAAKLRQAGLSGSKVQYIKGLAKAMDQKRLDFRKIRKLPEEEAIMELIQHKGIGRWTAEMFLIFSLGRLDVFSAGDAGLRNAVLKIYKPKNLEPKTLQRITDKWKPYRSIASLYLWASLDNEPKNN